MHDVQKHRQRQYAIHTVALGNGAVPGAASLFDTALTNGLLAIVASDWPGEELSNKPADEVRLSADPTRGIEDRQQSVAHQGVGASAVPTR